MWERISSWMCDTWQAPPLAIGHYSLQLSLSFVHTISRSHYLGGLLKIFLQTLLSPAGNSVISALGFLPLPDVTRDWYVCHCQI